MTGKYIHLPRAEYRAIVNQYLHPREEISLPNQLKDREKELSSLLDCFETPGAHAFVWGNKGVGKTSLAHTGCEKHNEIVEKIATVACEKDTSYSGLLTDITRKIAAGGKVNLSDSTFTGKLNLFGLEIGADKKTVTGNLKIDSVNHAVDLLNTLVGSIYCNGKLPIIIIDEFDRIENLDTKRQITDLVKELSVGGTRLKLLICGTANSLARLIGQHASSPRYIHQVEVKPLSNDGMLQIIGDIEIEFEIKFAKGQRFRITQIASGYPHFIHLILKDVLLEAHENRFIDDTVSQKLFKAGINRSLEQTEAHLTAAYKKATQRGTDVNIEILWAVAYGPHLSRQFKAIRDDYAKIMSERPTREQASETKIRNNLNALCKEPCGKILLRERTGWYSFRDPIQRSYTRLVAESNDIDLGQHNYRD